MIQEGGISLDMSHPDADGNGLENGLFSDPSVYGSRKISAHVRYFLHTELLKSKHCPVHPVYGSGTFEKFRRLRWAPVGIPSALLLDLP